MHRIWFDAIGRDSSPMHDALAVAAIFDPAVVTLEPVRARVRPDLPLPGTVEFNPVTEGSVTTVRVAKSVDPEAFHRLFFARIEQAVVSSKRALNTTGFRPERGSDKEPPPCT